MIIGKKFIGVVLLTALYSVVVNVILLAISRAYANAPSHFAPFTYPAVIEFTIGGVILAAIVYVAIGAFSENQNKTFLHVATVALLLSFIPDILLFWPQFQDPEDIGATPLVIAILMIMHILTAWIVVYMFTEKDK